MERIYFDSAATSYYRPRQVAEAVVGAMDSMGNSSRGTHETALAGARIIAGARQLVNELFDGYGAEQTAFTANSTESLNMALKGLLKPGDKVITTVMEHNSVLRPLYQLEALGVEVVRVGCLDGGLKKEECGDGQQEKLGVEVVRVGCLDGGLKKEECGDGQQEKRGQEGRQQDKQKDIKQMGLLDMDRLFAEIRPGVKAVVCTHASNLTGNVLDIRRIGRACREAGAVFIVDASQTAGVLPISMKEDFIDILCFTGHKGLMGPQGTGGICLRKGIVLEPLLTGGSGILTYSKYHPQQMPTALEAGTLNGHGIAGLRAALLWIKEHGGTEAVFQKENALAKAFYQEVKAVPGICFYGDYRSYEEHWSDEYGQRDEYGQGNEKSCGSECPEEKYFPGSGCVRAPMVTLNLMDEDSGEVSDWLAEEWGIDTRSGGHCAPLMHGALGTRKQGAVRFSFSHFNTMEQVKKAVQALREY